MNRRTLRATSRVKSAAPEQADVVGRHAHQHARARQGRDHRVGVEARQPDHARAGEQRRVDRHEQAVGVVDRQHVEQHVGSRRSPTPCAGSARSRRGCRGSAWRPWRARWCPRCRGSRPGRPPSAAPSRTPRAQRAAASPSEPRPAASRVKSLALRAPASAGDAGRPLRIADDRRRLGVAEEVVELGQGIGGVERQVDRAQPQAGEVQNRPPPGSSRPGPRPGRRAPRPGPAGHWRCDPRAARGRHRQSGCRPASRGRACPGRRARWRGSARTGSRSSAGHPV